MNVIAPYEMNGQMARVNVIRQRPLIIAIDHVFDDSYCDELILTSEQQQYEQAQITLGDNQSRTDTNVRNNDRILFDDPQLANKIFDKVKGYLPQTWDEGLWEISGLNERFRYYRYGPNQTFKPHFDGEYKQSKFHKSFLTLLFYLNDDFTGGETKFYQWQGGRYDSKAPTHIITPQKGQALLFAHQQLHEGAPVVSGVKYVLRTDVMYKALGVW